MELVLENLVENSSFEEGLRSWWVAKGPPESFQVDALAPHAGDASLRIEPLEPPEHAWIYTQRMPVEPWVRYRLQFFYRCESESVGPMWRVYPFEPGLEQTRGRAQWSTCNGATEWTACYQDFVFPEDVEFVQFTFMAGYWREGCDRGSACWLDDVQFGPAAHVPLADRSLVTEMSMVSNGGLECGSAGQAFGWPAFVSLGTQTYICGHSHLADLLPGAEVTWDTDAYLGERSLCISSPAADANQQIIVQQTLYPDEAVDYDIRFYAKAEGKGARVVLEPQGVEGKWVVTVGGAPIKGAEWLPYRLHYSPTEKVPVPCGLKLNVCQRGPGKVWIDEVEMVLAEDGFDEPIEVEAAPEPEVDVDELCRRGADLKRARNYVEAARILREAVACDPEHVESHWVLGWVLTELKENDEAAKAFKRVIELEPDSDRAEEAQRAIERLAR